MPRAGWGFAGARGGKGADRPRPRAARPVVPLQQGVEAGDDDREFALPADAEFGVNGLELAAHGVLADRDLPRGVPGAVPAPDQHGDLRLRLGQAELDELGGDGGGDGRERALDQQQQALIDAEDLRAPEGQAAHQDGPGALRALNEAGARAVSGRHPEEGGQEGGELGALLRVQGLRGASDPDAQVPADQPFGGGGNGADLSARIELDQADPRPVDQRVEGVGAGARGREGRCHPEGARDVGAEDAEPLEFGPVEGAPIQGARHAQGQAVRAAEVGGDVAAEISEAVPGEEILEERVGPRLARREQVFVDDDRAGPQPQRPRAGDARVVRPPGPAVLLPDRVEGLRVGGPRRPCRIVGHEDGPPPADRVRDPVEHVGPQVRIEDRIVGQVDDGLELSAHRAGSPVSKSPIRGNRTPCNFSSQSTFRKLARIAFDLCRSGRNRSHPGRHVEFRHAALRQ